MAKLTDTATTILSNAAARDDHRVFPLPRLKAPPVVVQKTLKSLIASGFIEEIVALREEEAWEQSEEKGRTTLIVTAAGLAAIGIADEPATLAPAKTGTKPAKGAHTRQEAAWWGQGGPKWRRGRVRAKVAASESRSRMPLSRCCAAPTAHPSRR